MTFTLEDSTTQQVPKILEDILEKIFSQNAFADSKQKDIFFIVIVVMMTENRLIPVLNNGEEWKNVKTFDVEQFCIWKKSMEVYEATFLMIGFNDIRIKLVMCPLGATVLISVLLSDIGSEVYSVCLPLSRYVVSAQASTVPMIFRDLKHLCLNFKNKIITPVKSSILSHYGYASASFVGIPEEILFDIMLNLSLKDIVSVSKCSKRLKLLLDNDRIWHQLYIRDFNDTSIESGNSWKILYKQEYINQKEKQQRSCCLAGALHDLMEVSDYVSYIDNPLWDEMIT